MACTAQPERAYNVEVLVVDDNDSGRQVAVRMLEKLGCQVQSVSNGDDAVELVKAQSFDVVFMDCYMPCLGGLDATKKIRESEEKTGGHVPIIAYTAMAMTGDEEDCITAGMDGYISKPALLDDFIQVMNKYVPDRV